MRHVVMCDGFLSFTIELFKNRVDFAAHCIVVDLQMLIQLRFNIGNYNVSIQ